MSSSALLQLSRMVPRLGHEACIFIYGASIACSTGSQSTLCSLGNEAQDCLLVQDRQLRVVSLATDAATERHRDLECSIPLDLLFPDGKALPYAQAREVFHGLGERKRCASSTCNLPQFLKPM